jgi:molybdopterin-containing oxidoreductase family iron-sulfur binding subunit
MKDENTPASAEGFTPPRHWSGLEELSAQYWSDEAQQESRGREFLHKPIETLEALEKLDTQGVARREFLTLMGAATAMSTLACARRPVHKIIPYVVPPEQITPGKANYYASVCKDVSDTPAILVKTREGRPIKLEGNDLDSTTGGTVSAQVQASVLNLYDLDRAKGATLIDRATGAEKQVPWDELDARVVSALSSAARVRMLLGVTPGPQTLALAREFCGAFRDGQVIHFEPLDLDSQADAAELLTGNRAIPAYDFTRAQVVVSIGGDFLGAWPQSESNARAWMSNRKLDSARASGAKMSRLFAFESNYSLTGANADERVAIRPGDELKIAMALLSEIAPQMARAQGYTLDAVAKDVGSAQALERLKAAAAALRSARGTSLVVAGGADSRSEDSLALQCVVAMLNSALGNEGQTVMTGRSYVGRGYKYFAKLMEEMRSGSVDVLILHRSNPVYSVPGFEALLKKVKFVVSVADRIDETAALGDAVAGDHHYLENWGDAEPAVGVYALQQPAIAPLHDTRAFEDSLLQWGKAAGLKMSASGTWYDVLRKGFAARFKGLSWDHALQKGWVGLPSRGSARSIRAGSAPVIPAFKPASNEPRLAIYSSAAMGDGRFANNPWLLEMPDPMTTATWDNFAAVSVEFARLNQLKTGDVVAVSLAEKPESRIELPVLVQPGLHQSTIAIASGYGRVRAGKVGQNCGWNAFKLSRTDREYVLSGSGVKVVKTGMRFELAITQGHHRTEGRPIVNDITLAEFRKNPKAEAHTDPHLRMEPVPTIWPKHDYSQGYRWAMAIDLSSCTGCGACVIACQAENNIPVVGRDRVRFSREMHWIKIDRYFSGPANDPEVVFQPMLCQHCENAPCETVCPVIATSHNEEGLNQMTYNRCVGTRYCANNCPYKVRRFNFFDHWKDYKDTMNLAWNPDVTVRTRGVMEKCSFCVQRIQTARDTTKAQGRKITDADLKTACQQTCPTEAIVFGNVNDPNSKVSKLREDARAFRVLEILNAKPMISYLSKVRNVVRNTEKNGAADGDAHH